MSEREPVTLKGWITIPEAARHKGVSVRAVRARVQEHALPTLRLGQKATLIRLADIDAWDVDRDKQMTQKQAGGRKRRLQEGF